LEGKNVGDLRLVQHDVAARSLEQNHDQLRRKKLQVQSAKGYFPVARQKKNYSEETVEFNWQS
jgi:hypothetical protein